MGYTGRANWLLDLLRLLLPRAPSCQLAVASFSSRSIAGLSTSACRRSQVAQDGGPSDRHGRPRWPGCSAVRDVHDEATTHAACRKQDCSTTCSSSSSNRRRSQN